MASMKHSNTRGNTTHRVASHPKPFVQWPRTHSRPSGHKQSLLDAHLPGTSNFAPVLRQPMSLHTSAAAADVSKTETTQQEASPALICTSVTATTISAFLEEIKEAEASGVDVIELRLDYISDFNPERDLEVLMAACTLPYIVTFRPKWEG